MTATQPWRTTVGLEVHAELNTATKMFCACKNDPDETRPNINICPICLAHPGTLPTINRAAVEQVLRIGSAIGGALADFSEFDRKSYFYPDIPKGYQISQYEHPLVAGGELAGVKITRVHLEEDTARSTHGDNKSLIDFNRAGIPLMELVTEPVIHDAETAGNFARELQLLLRTLGAGKANLEKGEMRIEANISVSRSDLEGADKVGPLGTKVEVKNLNSFRSVERAIAHEVERQQELIGRGEKVVQATRGWDENKQQTFAQRLKEGSADYRYFPEPDLPKFIRADLAMCSDNALRATLPELPWARRTRYQESFALSRETSAYICASVTRSGFFDAVTQELGDDRSLVMLATNYLVSDLAGIYAKSGAEEYAQLTPSTFAQLIRMTAAGDLSSRGAKEVLAVMAENGGDPEAVAKERGLAQIHDEDVLLATVQEILVANPSVVEDYKKGKEAALQYLVGQAMKATKGAGNPNILRKIILENASK